MTETEKNLLQALLDLEEAVRQLPTAHPKPNLLQRITRIDELAAQLPPGSDPELKHFLQRKSYEKARMHLEGHAGEVARGSCGH
jgi:hypothetical protein